MDERRSLPYSSSTAGRAITPSPHSSSTSKRHLPLLPVPTLLPSPIYQGNVKSLSTHGTLFPSIACLGKKTLKLVSNPPSFRDWTLYLRITPLKDLFSDTCSIVFERTRGRRVKWGVETKREESESERSEYFERGNTSIWGK